MSDAVTGIVTVATAIVGLAIVATLVSNRANTSNVIAAGGNAFSGAINAAVSPITGGPGLSLPSLQSGLSPG